MTKQFWDKIQTYAHLSDESKEAFSGILRKRVYKKHEYFIKNGQIPQTVGFVEEGLFSQYYIENNGDSVIKRFFLENYFVASTGAMLTSKESVFTIKALEKSTLFEYNFQKFKNLTLQYPDIAAFYIAYMERHWIIEKEPLEISFRYDTAEVKYADFLKYYPTLEPRLKQHEIASYLGVTPTQLSRVRAKISSKD